MITTATTPTQPDMTVVPERPARADGDRVYVLVALAVVLLTVVPVGSAVFYLGFARGDSPCVMCWEQRIGMLLIALVGLFVLRFGARPKYVGMAVIISLWGMFMGMRHTGMHAARDIGQGFSLEILGAHTYTWALVTYWLCALAMGLLLLMVKPRHLDAGVRALTRLDRIAFGAFVVVVAANAVQAFASTGPPPFMGQSDPVRFSFDPRHWVWSLEEWKPTVNPISLRGRWGVEKPDVATASPDADAGPLGTLPPLTVKSRRKLALPLDGPPTDLAYDAATGRFLITTAAGVHLADSALSRIERHTVVDAGYAVDLARFAGAAFLDQGELIAVGDNKSYVVLRPSDSADGAANFRYFLESRDRFDEVTRGRFGTVRARLMYVMSAAYDPASRSVYTITVPNRLTQRMVVSRFDRRDLTLSEEWSPEIAAPLSLGQNRSLGEFMVSGAAITGGRLAAVSAAYPSLLVIDLASRKLVAAWSLPGVMRPVGVALKGDDAYVLDDGGTITIVDLRTAPGPG
jgi:disulfide bond formation protein DsbB